MRKILSRHRNDFFLLLLFLIIGGIFSWLNGQDANWDLLNYHLYNPFALLTGRFGSDIMPAGIHTFLNPLLDVPLYLLIKYFNAYPQWISFLQGFWGGALGFTLYKICKLFFREEKSSLTSWLAFAIGITGSAFLSQTGLSYNEVPMAFLLCTSFYFLLIFINGTTSTKWAFWAAFIAGAAGGLKYTGAPFVLGLTAAFFINLRSYKKPAKATCLFVLGGLLGFLATNGYFMFRLYHTYGNPLFPFFNSIFQSPYFDPVSFDEVRFYPRSFSQWLFYPFFWIFPNDWIVSEGTIADARLALAQIAFFGLLLVNLVSKQPRKQQLLKSLLAFCAVSFICWLNFYGILRYLVTLEVLSGVLIVLALRQIFAEKTTALISAGILVVLSFTTVYPNLGRERFFDHALEITPTPNVENNALVLLVGQPLSFFAPFFPQDTRFIGGIKLPVSKYPRRYWSPATQRYPLTKLYYAYHFEKDVQQALSQHTGPIYMLTIPWERMTDPLFLKPLGLQAANAPCQEFDVNINIYVPSYILCPLEKIKQPESI